MSFDREALLKEYRNYKKKAQAAFKRQDYEKSLFFAQYAAHVAWRFPILSKFIDDELESFLGQIAQKITVNSPAAGATEANKVVFYAGQMVDTNALTEQYLFFLVEKGYQILVVIPDKANCVAAPSTLKYLGEKKNVEVFISAATTSVEKIKDITNKVKGFRAANAFLHFLPDDVIGYCVFSQVANCKRYYIVHNDHTYWIGKGCSDYFLEFRKFGCQVASERRGIAHSRIFTLPYYPINSKSPFKGFPFERKEDTVIGLSGGKMYKYLMDPELAYFKAVKEILRQNENFIFCLCGGGNSKKIVEIFNEPGIRGRFHYLGKRSDFYALIGEIDILFESYPLKGGLTVLFATEQNKAVVGIGNNKDASRTSQDNLELEGYIEPMNTSTFITESNRLIRSKQARLDNAALFAANRYNKTDFDNELQRILGGQANHYSPVNGEKFEFDDDYFLNQYLSVAGAEYTFLKYKLKTFKPSDGIVEFGTTLSKVLFMRLYYGKGGVKEKK